MVHVLLLIPPMLILLLIARHGYTSSDIVSTTGPTPAPTTNTNATEAVEIMGRLKGRLGVVSIGLAERIIRSALRVMM